MDQNPITPTSNPEPIQNSSIEPVLTPSQTTPEPVSSTPAVGSTPVAPASSEPAVASPSVVVGGFDTVASNTPAPSPMPTNPSTAPAGNPMQTPPKKKWTDLFKKKKSILLVIAPIIILGGGAAAAYEGIVVPNKPANVLKTAIVNSLQQPDITLTGNLQDSKAGNVAYKVNLSAEVNRPAKAADLSLNMTVSGVSIPVEARLVNGSAYFKFGDLTTVGSLLSAVSPSSSSQIKTLASQLSNHWFSVDSTIIDESSTLKCLMNLNWTTSKSDTQVLENEYMSHSFLTINSTSSTTLNGQNVEEFKLGLNDDKAAAFLKALGGSSYVQQLNKCSGSSASSASNEYKSLADNDTTPVTLWINKSTKQIVQIQTNSTAQDAKSGVNGNGAVDISYKPVSISAPSNAQSVLQLITELESASGSSSSSGANLSNLFSSF